MKGRVKIQTEYVAMAAELGDISGGSSGHQLDTANIHFSQGSSRQMNGIPAEVDGLSDDPIETYFACITTCSLDDGDCITICTEQLRESH
jgi:hypothetical protein